MKKTNQVREALCRAIGRNAFRQVWQGNALLVAHAFLSAVRVLDSSVVHLVNARCARTTSQKQTAPRWQLRRVRLLITGRQEALAG